MWVPGQVRDFLEVNRCQVDNDNVLEGRQAQPVHDRSIESLRVWEPLRDFRDPVARDHCQGKDRNVREEVVGGVSKSHDIDDHEQGDDHVGEGESDGDETNVEPEAVVRPLRLRN